MKEHLLEQFEVVTALAMRNLEGVDHELSLRSTPDTAKPIYWVLGHLTATYDALLPSLERERVAEPGTLDPFRRGSRPVSAEEAPMPFLELVELFQRAATRFREGLRQLPENRYTEKAPFSPRDREDETLLSLLFLIACHQAYHCGQLGILRQACGLGPAVG